MSTEKTIGTLKEAALLAAGAIGAAWALDRNQGQLAVSILNPSVNGTNGVMYQHWGGIVAVGAAWGSTQVQNPYAKALLIGATIYGVLVEARQDFGWNNTTTPPSQQWGMMGPDKQVNTSDLNEKLRAAAAKRRTAGPGVPMSGNRITKGYSGVGRNNVAMAGNRITRGYSGVGRGAWN